MKKRELDWVGIVGKICMVLILTMIVVYGIIYKDDIELISKKNEPFVTISEYYNDNNTFQKIVYDPDTMVMYAILDGTKMTPLYNADGTLKTYKPE